MEKEASAKHHQAVPQEAGSFVILVLRWHYPFSFLHIVFNPPFNG